MSTNKTAMSEAILSGNGSESAIASALMNSNEYVIGKEKKGKRAK